MSLPAAFGKYQLLNHLAEGGMADVYLGRLPGPGGFEKRLVIKVIRPDLAARREFCDMFVAEAKLTVSLTHSNIVPVFELGMVDGVYFLAMDLVDGPTLHQLVFDRRPGRGGPVPFALSAYVVEQVLRGLDYAHRHDVVHRDLSAANVMCSRDGEVKIVDFGIAAKLHTQPWSVRLAGGSDGYMAPEQHAGAPLDARADLYAVGVLLGEMCTGQRFADLDLDHLPAVPAALVDVLRRATQRRPEDRYPDAAAMLADVSRFLRTVDPPTQADLSRLIRRRAPDERRPPAGSPAPSSRSAPSAEAPGPSTAQAPGPQTPALPRASGTPITSGAGWLPAEHPATAPGLTQVFASRSRPAPLRPTWRTFAFCGTLLLLLALLLLAVRLAVPKPAESRRPVPPLEEIAVLQIDLPPGAMLLIDGRRAASHGALSLAPGPHHIEARGAGRQAVAQTLVLHPGETVRLQPTLPWSRGKLHVRSTPAGAQVTLDGQPAGTTPLSVEVPLDRPATLRLSSKGHVPLSRAVTPTDWPGRKAAADSDKDEPQPEMQLDLPLQALAPGTLTVGAVPWAQVYVDGERRGDTPLRRLPLIAGPHTLRLVCPTSQPPGDLRLNVVIEPGRELRRVVDFRASRPQVQE